MNSQHKQFGLDRLYTVLQRGEEMPQALLQKVTDAVAGFVEEYEQSDDLTMLAIHYTPKVEKVVLDESLTLRNDSRQVAQLSTFVKDVTGRLPLNAKQAGEIRLAVEEAVVNVMEYAYPVGTEGDVTIEVKSDGQQVKFIISDTGVAFDPTEAAKADTTLSAEDRPIGGLGILLVRRLMDSINYERVDGRNILTLKKTIQNN
jgi:sigma-B regulation protein RsbU (phosphoserine phosphatase)